MSELPTTSVHFPGVELETRSLGRLGRLTLLVLVLLPRRFDGLGKFLETHGGQLRFRKVLGTLNVVIKSLCVRAVLGSIGIPNRSTFVQLQDECSPVAADNFDLLKSLENERQIHHFVGELLLTDVSSLRTVRQHKVS